ncbi:MAG: type II toxin-antitoxin system RelE/ParE family toxin [archaeon]|nr:type II toxin-antitoxin system RelE/ParE family toxin [archaeon]
MIYKAEFTKEFLRTMEKLKKKDMTLFDRLEAKIKEILEHPGRYKSLKGKLSGLRRAHVRPFVIIFKVKEDAVTFISFKHHDRAYK